LLGYPPHLLVANRLMHWLNVTVLVASESQTRELNQHRTKTIENEAGVERLKRQLISERFERFLFILSVSFSINRVCIKMTVVELTLSLHVQSKWL